MSPKQYWIVLLSIFICCNSPIFAEPVETTFAESEGMNNSDNNSPNQATQNVVTAQPGQPAHINPTIQPSPAMPPTLQMPPNSPYPSSGAAR